MCTMCVPVRSSVLRNLRFQAHLASQSPTSLHLSCPPPGFTLSLTHLDLLRSLTTSHYSHRVDVCQTSLVLLVTFTLWDLCFVTIAIWE